jgi:hypothetical protein
MSDVLIDENGNEVIEEKVIVNEDENLENDDPVVQEDNNEDATLRTDDHTNDEELAGAVDDEEREAIRARRREERRNRKQAQKDREETLRRELSSRDAIINDLRAKVDGIERRNSSSELAQLETVEKQVAHSYNFFKDQIRVATEAGNGAAVADATENMIKAQRKFDEIQTFKKAMKQRQATPQPLDPRMVNQANKWMERNKWYSPGSNDQDTELAMVLDKRMHDEGWDPTTEAYWQELDGRIKKYLPHRATGGKVAPTRPKSVVTGSGRESGSARDNGTFRLSAERVQALKEAGTWDDPKQRAEAVKRYREFDKANQGQK